MFVQIFKQLQAANFYQKIHSDAVQMVNYSKGNTWLDVGCGPGILSIMASLNGYKVRGIDRSEPMINAAKAFSKVLNKEIEFLNSDLEKECELKNQYDIVSASSLICVMDTPSEGLRQLQSLVKPNGALLIIEATPQMNFWKALKIWLSGQLGKNGFMLLLWSFARSGRAIDPKIFTKYGGYIETHYWLENMVAAYLIR